MFSKVIRYTIGVVLLLMILVFIPLRYSNEVFAVKFLSLKETIYDQREIANPVELTAITDKIADYNESLECRKWFYNDITKIFYPSDFDSIERIK